MLTSHSKSEVGMRGGRWIAGFVAVGLIAAAEPARAQTASDSERAEKLFTEASQLTQDGKFEDACPKFAESERLDPALGTQANLALCYEKIGKLASAYRNFRAVQTLAHATGKKGREDTAREKLAELKPKLSYLVVEPKDADAIVKVDDEPVAHEDWAFVPVDVGDHKVEATAQGKKLWTATVSMPAGANQKVDVAIPALIVIQGQTQFVTVTKETNTTKRTLGFAIAGIGVVGVAGAVVTGLIALNDKSTADSDCKPQCATQNGRDAVSQGKVMLPINAVAWGVGIVGLGVGTFLILTSGKKSPPKDAAPAKAQFVPMLAPGTAGLGVRGNF